MSSETFGMETTHVTGTILCHALLLLKDSVNIQLSKKLPHNGSLADLSPERKVKSDCLM